ncbi:MULTISPECIES: EH signature domain-containing protein [unclassified Bradyrhizobium]|uniref:EH signature domain-containing protein n=1 Tax=unclassified Bradyrhizobium TaxID=2631580 RepID=UPI00247AC95C|nr:MULTISPECIES: EH signature domain-containing protein [unclassified Bradyrhizobium]WGS18961.1 EH signature domain-containing protein [Bradyrhizobium sp. ISRA463]WGS25795.1 EH signature domain-containing protein [Bradyrhizobium sp. ISRA464]
MIFRDALKARRRLPPPLCGPTAVARLLSTLSARPSGEFAKPTVDLNAVAERFVYQLSRGGEPTVGDWNKITWCIWTTKPAIAEYNGALEAVLARVAEMRRKRPYRQLASVYLMEFAPNRPQLDRISYVLSSFAPVAGEPWIGLNARYDIFNGAARIVQLAQAALGKQLNVQAFLETIGLSSSFAEGEFAAFMHAAGLKILQGAPIVAAPERLDIIRRWCLGPDDRLIFPVWRKEMARALTLPFGNALPAQADRDLISNFLVGRFGDPRINGAQWIGLDDVADILKRWLTEQSLRQFFDVVDRIAPDGAWKYRRKFWLAFHNHGLIRNAWVVFGEDGAAEARSAFGREAPFGVFNYGGRKAVQRGHAVLLLDFGQCIVADWSYNGFCNIWPNNSRAKPPGLNLRAYSSDDVRRPVPTDRTEQSLTRHDIFGHGGSENYVWQNRVARRLQELTGVRIPQSEYTVR